MPTPRKMQSVLELARYKIGTEAWWVTLRPLMSIPALADDDQWMDSYHPKALFLRGPYKSLWPSAAKLPKLQHLDFQLITTILTSKLVVEQFVICEIFRSSHTGEFFYSNADDEWVPEPYLFNKKSSAQRECTRILHLIKKWVGSH